MYESTAWSRRPDTIKKALLWSLLSAFVLFLIAPAVGNAEVVTNITSSGLLTDVQPPSDGVYNITHGTRPGGGPNLFHSFGDFSIGQGDIANFLNDSGLTTSNIIGRVTGGNISNIDGIIRTTGFDVGGVQASLFLVNPFGIVFGPHGSFDVDGSVSFSTAQYLRLSHGVTNANFYANPDNDGQANSILVMDPLVNFGFLSTAVPAAYGFLTAPDPNATITIQGSVLSVLPGHSISLVGREVVIQGDTLPDRTIQPAHLLAPDGSILLASAASPGEFGVITLQALPNVNGASFSSFGSVSLANGSSIDVSGASTVAFIKDGQLVLSVKDAVLTTSQTLSSSKETISLRRDSSIVTSNSGTDLGADVQLIASRVQMNGASSMVSTTRGDGSGGDITVNVGRLSLANGAQIRSDNASSGIGQGGKVTIQGRSGAGSSAASVSLTDGSAIATRSVNPEQGGDVAIAAENVHLDFSNIFTQTFVSGHGGDIHMTADSLTLENRANIFSSGSGMGGDLILNVRTLSLLGGLSGGSLITSTTTSTSNGVGGDVTIQGISHEEGSVAEKVVLSGGSGITSLTTQSGAGGQISVTAESVDLYVGSSINSTTQGTGDGGNIVVGAQQLHVLDGATISSSTTSGSGLLSAGAGGMVTVQGLEGAESKASSVELSGQNSRISSDSTSGVSGEIKVNAGTLTITNGATISAGTLSSTGPAGEVMVTADSVIISAGGQIFSRSFAQGAGPVDITANELTMDNGSIVASTASENKNGLGGNVELHVGTVSLTNGASIKSQSETSSKARAGDITMNVGSLTLANQAEISSSSLSTDAEAGDAGSVTIIGNAVSLASGSSLTSATIGPGAAGQVIVTTPTLNMDDATITTSTSSTGNAGSITANVGTMNLTNGSNVSSNSTGTLSGAGDAGSIMIKASGNFTSNGSKVSTSAENAKGGDILIDAQNVQLSNGTLISASSNAAFSETGDGNAGNITITSASNVVMQNSSVTTEASDASGGNIEIHASDTGMIQLVNSRVSTSVGGLAKVSDGGNINIDPQFVVLQNSQILAQAVAGAGGAIDIIATSAFIADPASIVSASSSRGISGTVDIQSPLQNVGGELAALSQEFSSAAALLAQQCAARAAGGKFSTFVVAAREGLPVGPGGSLASPSLTSEQFGSILSQRGPHTSFSTVTDLFPKYDARPIQLAKFGDTCR